MSLTDKKILTANQAFYHAFAQGDFETLQTLWAKREDITVIHPGWPLVIGHETVMASWQEIIRNQGSFAIRCVDETITHLPDACLVTCIEILSGSKLAATNIFVNEDRDWRLIHHHASSIVADVEAEITGTVH